MKKIQFIPEADISLLSENYPIPALKKIPKWYKNIKRYKDNEKFAGVDESGLVNSTVKKCMPFRDAMTSGYIWSLPTDLDIRKQNGLYNIRWIIDYTSVLRQSDSEIEGLPKIINEEKNEVFKFVFDFRIKTPKGYSTLFTHPFNRHDLPFRTFSGVVDTDKFILAVNFPFQLSIDLKEDENYILKKGTPVVQFIPIKREDWKSVNLSYDPKDPFVNRFNQLRSTLVSSYKDQFWQKKSYE